MLHMLHMLQGLGFRSWYTTAGSGTGSGPGSIAPPGSGPGSIAPPGSGPGSIAPPG